MVQVQVQVMDPEDHMILECSTDTRRRCSTRVCQSRLTCLHLANQSVAGSSNTGAIVAAGAAGVVGGALIANALSDDDYQDGYEAGKPLRDGS
jgi:hypothetical protein